MNEAPTPPGGSAPLIDPTTRTTPRLGRFVGGFLSGLVLVPLFSLIVGLGVSFVLANVQARTEGAGTFASQGDDISRAGGAIIVWTRLNESTRQTCRGRCDDLTFRGGRPKAVLVRGPDGRAVAGRSPQARPVSKAAS